MTSNYKPQSTITDTTPSALRFTHTAFWETQIRRAGISAPQSRIPEFPRPIVDGTTTPRSPRRTLASAFSQMEQYLTNNPISHRASSSRPLLSMSRASREREAEMASVGGDIDSTSPVDARRRLQRLQSLRSSDRTYSSGSEGSMDAQASTTAADDSDMPTQSRNLLSFVESRAQITDLENQLDRLHARMLVGRNAQAAREEFRRENDRRYRLVPQRHILTGSRSDSRIDPPSRLESSIAGDRSWASNATDGSNSVASLDDSNSSVSLEVQVSTPQRPPRPPTPNPREQSEENTPTSNPPAERTPGRIWSLANSVQDIETELAHLSEGAARRSAELASLSQQLEQQTRQYAAHRSIVDESGSPSGTRDHSDILGRASEGLRQLRELRERREQHERAEHIQQVWGNVDDDDYVSPVSAL